MKSSNLYALLVGINTYPEKSRVRSLIGCLNDIERMDILLQLHLPEEVNYEPILLRNHEATRERIIREFETHLSKATEGDKVLFMFCGHGSRQPSDPVFHSFYPDGEDETLVCYNSRLPGGLDLADKELAVMLRDVLGKDVHGVVILDCCHSGSGTRSLADIKSYAIREANPRPHSRPLDSYLNGFYANMYRAKGRIRIPPARHITLAACTRHQRAKEHFGGYGEFSNALIRALEKSQLDLSYQRLYSECRQAIVVRSIEQTPQFEPKEGGDMESGFLGFPISVPIATPHRLPLKQEAGHFFIEMGELHGLIPEKVSKYHLEIFESGKTTQFAAGGFVGIGPERSEVGIRDAEKISSKTRYEIKFSGVSKPATVFSFKGPLELLKRFCQILPAGFEPETDQIQASAPYGFKYEHPYLNLLHLPSCQTISLVDTREEEVLPILADDLRQIRIWHLILDRTTRSGVDPFTKIDIEFGYRQGETWKKGKANGAQEICIRQDATEDRVYPHFRVRNLQEKKLFFALLYLSPHFGTHYLFQNEVISSNNWIDLWGREREEELFIPEDAYHSIDTFSLLVSESPIEYSSLLFSDISFGEQKQIRHGIKPVSPAGLWTIYGTQFLFLKQLGEISPTPISVGNGNLTIGSSTSLSGTVAILPSSSPILTAYASCIGINLLEDLGEAANLINLGNRNDFDYDTVKIDELKRIGHSGISPLQLNLNLGIPGQNMCIWCVGLHQDSLSILAEEKLDATGSTDLELHLNGQQFDTIWLWFYLFKSEPLVPEYLERYSF